MQVNLRARNCGTEAAKRLGVGENTLRRAEGKGWITPEWRTWGDRQPMRFYQERDLPKVRERMVEAGFGFQGENGMLTTAEMARALGISQTHLRRLERQGVIPSPERDTAGRRKWRKAHVAALRRELGQRGRS